MTRTREEIELELAFAVNGTLPDADMAEIEDWLLADDQLRAEHAALAAIRSDMQTEEVNSPGEFGLARLMRDVKRDAVSENTPVAAPPVQKNRSWMWQLAAAVAMVALLGQNLFIGGSDDAGFEMASAEVAADMVASFVPDATEEQIRTLLLDLEVEIIAGPSALGFYDLSVLDGADQSAAMTGLMAATEVIESVENVQN